MTARRKPKNVKQRGSMTHGYGSKKKHRGAGHRGGRGAAGSGKRGDANKPSLWKTRYFGKRGFKNYNPSDKKTMNIMELDANIDKYVSSGLIKKEGDAYLFDATSNGYTKLLGKGQISIKITINIADATKIAVNKVEKAGGKVIIPSKQQTEE